MKMAEGQFSPQPAHAATLKMMDPVGDNPFFVLELPATATPMEIERQGKMILARLELRLASASTYPSPLGPRPRTADDVRRAMRALGDPRTRLAAEPFAKAGLSRTTVDPAPGVVADTGAAVGAATDDDADAPARFDLGAWLWWRA
jgi:hypothetical protein